jgi:hypothetical protein
MQQKTIFYRKHEAIKYAAKEKRNGTDVMPVHVTRREDDGAYVVCRAWDEYQAWCIANGRLGHWSNVLAI